MRCKEVQERIDLGFTSSAGELDVETRAHIESCKICGSYLNEAVGLRAILNTQDIAVLSGELDGISFESIMKTAAKQAREPVLSHYPKFLKWSWVPAAAAAIFILFAVFPSVLLEDGGQETVELIDWSHRYYIYDSEDIDSANASSIIDSTEILTLMEEEVIFQSDIDDLIELLNDEEFDLLYEQLSDQKGSSG